LCDFLKKQLTDRWIYLDLEILQLSQSTFDIQTDAHQTQVAAADEVQMAADEVQMAADEVQMAADEVQMAADEVQMAENDMVVEKVQVV
jgi:phage baseplate assembly protein gpV